MDAIMEDFSGHLKKGIREEAEKRIWEAAPHYLWYWADKRGKAGICTACWQRIRMEKIAPGDVLADYSAIRDAMEESQRANGFRSGIAPGLSHWSWLKPHKLKPWTHGAFGHCPDCGATVEYRCESLGRRYMQDTVCLAHYSRSALEKETRVMTLWQATIDWAGWRPENQFQPDMHLMLQEVCLLQRGKPGQRYVKERRWWADLSADGKRAENFTIRYQWAKRRECKSGFAPAEDRPLYAAGRQLWARDEWSALAAFQGTAANEIYQAGGGWIAHLDGIDFYHACMRYPCIEYLVKLGYTELAHGVIDHTMGREMNLRGKTGQAVLRVDGNTWGWLRGKKVKLTERLLKLIHARDRLGLRVGNDLLLCLSGSRLEWTDQALEMLCLILSPGQREKALRYAAKMGINRVEYMDHLDLIRRLGEDLANDELTRPRHFADMHERLAERARALTEKEKDAVIARRAEKLGAYWFAACGLTLRPMMSAAEIVREGAQLRHCVGGYVRRYADGETILLCLREEDKPQTPLYTVEYSTRGTRVQVRGYKNGMMEGYCDGVKIADQERLKTFWRLFELYQADYRKAHKNGGCAA